MSSRPWNCARDADEPDWLAWEPMACWNSASESSSSSCEGWACSCFRDDEDWSGKEAGWTEIERGHDWKQSVRDTVNKCRYKRARESHMKASNSISTSHESVSRTDNRLWQRNVASMMTKHHDMMGREDEQRTRHNNNCYNNDNDNNKARGLQFAKTKTPSGYKEMKWNYGIASYSSLNATI